MPSPFQVPTRFWFRTEVLLWWTKAGPMPSPLATLGSPNDAVPGALGQPGTQTIYGGDSVNFGAFTGLRLQSGFWLDPDQTFAIEGEYFLLGRQFSGFSAFSDGFGNPLIARPVVNAQTGNEGAYVDSLPGNVAGGINVFNSSALQGWEINGLWNFVQSDQLRLGGMLGFRYLNLSESLEVQDQLSGATTGALTFAGQPISPDESLADFDRFRATNNFYGGLLGARLTWSSGRWVINAAAKMSLGTNQERTIVQGATTLYNSFGTAAVLPGGVLATTANIGNYYRSPFAVAPEANFTLGFMVTPRMMVRVGYSFLYLSNVLRPGNQVNRVASPNLVPSDVGYGAAGPNQPGYQFHASSYWAQGLNVGLEFRF
ncbi:MAG TPA: BBP7 family outer membrane beta-barrel protein [Pirellulales bacterium]|nr:BBP7 family outer membrane beta-barrel protein [Pirellulales bacterium]